MELSIYCWTLFFSLTQKILIAKYRFMLIFFYAINWIWPGILDTRCLGLSCLKRIYHCQFCDLACESYHFCTESWGQIIYHIISK